MKLDVYKAALALNDNKSVSITCVVPWVPGGLPPPEAVPVLRGELGCSLARGDLHSFLLPLGNLELLVEKITGSSPRFNAVHSKG